MILWNYSMELFYGIILWNYSMELFYGIILWNDVLGNCGIVESL